MLRDNITRLSCLNMHRQPADLNTVHCSLKYNLPECPVTYLPARPGPPAELNGKITIVADLDLSRVLTAPGRMKTNEKQLHTSKLNHGRFTSSLALPAESDGSSSSVWLQQDNARQVQQCRSTGRSQKLLLPCSGCPCCVNQKNTIWLGTALVITQGDYFGSAAQLGKSARGAQARTKRLPPAAEAAVTY